MVNEHIPACTGNDDPRVPERMGMSDPNIRWRYGGPPNYAVANTTWLREKQYDHEKGSLAWIIESVIKTFEMEASHKLDVKDWVSVDVPNFRYSTNGGPYHNADSILARGTYNVFLDRCPIYNEIDREESEQRFKTAFPKGFVWEVKEALSGPPDLSFTWRHWATYDGPYEGHQPTHKTLEMQGSVRATINDKLQLQTVDLYFDPNPLIMDLLHVKPGSLHHYTHAG